MSFLSSIFNPIGNAFKSVVNPIAKHVVKPAWNTLGKPVFKMASPLLSQIAPMAGMALGSKYGPMGAQMGGALGGAVGNIIGGRGQPSEQPQMGQDGYSGMSPGHQFGGGMMDMYNQHAGRLPSWAQDFGRQATNAFGDWAGGHIDRGMNRFGMGNNLGYSNQNPPPLPPRDFGGYSNENPPPLPPRDLARFNVPTPPPLPPRDFGGYSAGAPGGMGTMDEMRNRFQQPGFGLRPAPQMDRGGFGGGYSNPIEEMNSRFASGGMGLRPAQTRDSSAFMPVQNQHNRLMDEIRNYGGGYAPPLPPRDYGDYGNPRGGHTNWRREQGLAG